MMNPYTNPQFDCIKHINSLFPNEQSLSNIDSEINKLQAELSVLQKDLQEDIHSHAIMQEEMWKEVQQVDVLARGVVLEIQDIKQKAEKSEELVYQMCKDIKSLDIAKRNLTFSIKALRQYTMMLNAIDNLRSACVQKKYKQIAMLLSAFEELGSQFKKFENIPQITEITNERDQIIKELGQQIIEDFIVFIKGNSLQSASDMSEACAVIETLGLKFRNEVVHRLCRELISPYEQLFQQIENKNLENTERRYAWLSRTIKDFDIKFNLVFPEYWAVHCNIYLEFSSITRMNIMEILEKNADQQDIAVLMKALQQTLKFEQRINDEMKKRYDVWIQYIHNKKSASTEGQKITVQIPELSQKFIVDSIPKFKGIISDCYEPYLRPYVDNEEKELQDGIIKALSTDELDVSSDLKVFNSSFYMFNYYKQLLKRASQYSRLQVMFDIYKLIKRSLKFYSDELNSKVQREYRQMSNEHNFHALLSFSINTAEYCKETLPGLQESVVANLDSPFSDQVDFSNEEEYYNQMINKSVETLLLFMDGKVDPSFQKMAKINWEQLDNMVDVSDYVKETKSILEPHIQRLKEILSETYLIFYLNKLVVFINNKFISNVYRSRKISEMGLNQLMLDIYEIRMTLIGISKLKSDSKSQTSYTNFVNKTMARSESILKLIQMMPEKFVENFGDYAKKYSIETAQQDLDRILLVKGMKKQDYPQLFKIFQK